jgi:hypothetical protein
MECDQKSPAIPMTMVGLSVVWNGAGVVAFGAFLHRSRSPHRSGQDDI